MLIYIFISQLLSFVQLHVMIEMYKIYLYKGVKFVEFKDISYIIAVYDHKSISQAAHSLFISQPALSQQIHKIETQLGKLLFMRTSHSITPTAACRIIVEQGRKLLAERDMMMYAVNHLQDAPEESLAFGMSPFYSRHLLPGILYHFQKHHPQYTLHFADKGNSLTLEKEVIEGKLDCCLVPMHPANPGIEYLPIDTEEIFLAVPRDHPLNHLSLPDGSMDVALTKDEPYIMHRDSDKVAALQEKLFVNAGFKPHISHTATGWDTVTSFISSGMGLGLLTELVYGDYRPENLPCLYRVRNMDMSRTFALGYRRGRILTASMSCLLEAAKSEFARLKTRAQ